GECQKFTQNDALPNRIMMLMPGHGLRVYQVSKADGSLIQAKFAKPTARAIVAFRRVFNDFRLQDEQRSAIVAEIGDRCWLWLEHQIACYAIFHVGFASNRRVIHPLDSVLVGKVTGCYAAVPEKDGLGIRVER